MTLSRQEVYVTGGRVNQKARTRQALIDAALALAREGKSPTMAEVADVALVSVPTAYRYFADAQQLWLEVAAHTSVPPEPTPDAFASLPDDDVAARVDLVVQKLGWLMLDDESVWRNVVMATLQHWFAQADLPEAQRRPVRSERRMNWINAALEPLHGQLPDATIRQLTMALALVFGTEAMITLRDVCRLETDEAKQIMQWASRAVLMAAIDATGRGGRAKGSRSGR